MSKPFAAELERPRSARRQLECQPTEDIMTYDPYQDAGLRRDLPRTEPRRFDLDETRTARWVPIAIVVALIIGAAFYFYGQTSTTGPQVRADSGTVTKSEPSPN